MTYAYYSPASRCVRVSSFLLSSTKKSVFDTLALPLLNYQFVFFLIKIDDDDVSSSAHFFSSLFISAQKGPLNNAIKKSVGV